MTVTIIGIGLIGGSMALSLKDKNFATKVIGVDTNKLHEAKALELNIVDEVLPLDKAIQASQVLTRLPEFCRTSSEISKQ